MGVNPFSGSRDGAYTVPCKEYAVFFLSYLVSNCHDSVYMRVETDGLRGYLNHRFDVLHSLCNENV